MRLLWVLLLCALPCAGPSRAADAPACGPEALGTSRTMAVDGGAGLTLGLQSYDRTLALADREVVLTFDDGPSRYTAKVLDALARECVLATFFLIGRNAEAMPGIVRRMAALGHGVAHHSYSHPAGTLRRMTATAARADIEKGFAAVEQSGYGGEPQQALRTPFFRFPGFADTPDLLSFLAQRGLAVFGADLWASDWQAMTPQVQLGLLMARLQKARRGVILMHDTKLATAQMLPSFLRQLQQGGYRVVHIVPGPGPTPVDQALPGWTSSTEALIALLARRAGPVRAGGR